MRRRQRGLQSRRKSRRKSKARQETRRRSSRNLGNKRRSFQSRKFRDKIESEQAAKAEKGEERVENDFSHLSKPSFVFTRSVSQTSKSRLSANIYYLRSNKLGTPKDVK